MVRIRVPRLDEVHCSHVIHTRLRAFVVFAFGEPAVRMFESCLGRFTHAFGRGYEEDNIVERDPSSSFELFEGVSFDTGEVESAPNFCKLLRVLIQHVDEGRSHVVLSAETDHKHGPRDGPHIGELLLELFCRGEEQVTVEIHEGNFVAA